MRKIRIFVLFMILLSSLPSYSKDIQQCTSYLEFSPQATMKTILYASMQQDARQDTSKIRLYNHPDYILPKRALLFSAIIPGAGQLYCKSYLKSIAFFSIEVGAWTMYAIYQQKGKDKEKEFISYADEYWNEDKWRAWFNKLTDEQQKVFSHSLPETKTQQYYEMIGKYDQFLVGWESVPDDLLLSEIHDYSSPLREKYMDMRYDSNQMFKRATTGAYVSMFNHILSAIDAAWTAKRHNGRLLKASLQFENKLFDLDYQTFLSLKVNW